jgi:hypothetical protein
MTSDWPPRAGQLWMAAERWPATGVDPEIPGGAWVTILHGEGMADPPGAGGANWWRGEVLGPNGVTFIKAAEGDLLPAGDPRFTGAA